MDECLSSQGSRGRGAAALRALVIEALTEEPRTAQAPPRASRDPGSRSSSLTGMRAPVASPTRPFNASARSLGPAIYMHAALGYDAIRTGLAFLPMTLGAALQAGARVVGVDLTPELFAAAGRRAADAGVEVDWVEGDAEALPFDDESFDAVVSTFGVMFAPRHSVAAAELVRVLRPGGRLGLCSWTPEGHVGAFLSMLAGHVGGRGGEPPALWGAEDHLRGLFEGTGLDIELDRETVMLRFDSVERAVEVYETAFGPVVTARAQLEPQGRYAALRDDLARLFERHDAGRDGTFAFPGEYLVAIGHRR